MREAAEDLRKSNAHSDDGSAKSADSNAKVADSSVKVDRRQFARRAGSIAVAALLPLTVEAQDKAPADEFTDWPQVFSPADQGEVRAKYANLLRVYGDRLSVEEKRRARTTLIGHQRSLIVIRAIKTENWDPMATTTRIEELGEPTPR